MTTIGPASSTDRARIKPDTSAPATSRRVSWWRWVDVAVLLAVGLALIGFRFSDWDLALQQLFLEVDESGSLFFPLEIEPWYFIYRFGVAPAALVVGLATVLFGISYASLRIARARRAFVYLIAVLAIGPGLVTNLMLKDHWGRPRPRDVVEFGGAYPFEPVLTRDSSTPGKSFPCGHATMGFFFVAGWFIFRRRRPRLALGWLAFALVFGGLISVTRMAQGGHFASDGVAALGVMWLTAWSLEALFRRREVGWELSARHLEIMASRHLRRRWWLAPCTMTALVALIGGVALATPVGGPVDFKLDSAAMAAACDDPHGPTGDVRLTFDFAPGEIWLRSDNPKHPLPQGSLFSLSGEVRAHGLPWSRVERDWKMEQQDNGWRGYWRDRVKGRFTELRQTLELTVAVGSFDRLRFRMDDGVVMLELPADASRRPAWQVEGKRNQLVLDLPHEVAVDLRLAPEVDADPGRLRQAGFRPLAVTDDEPTKRWARGAIGEQAPRHRIEIRGQGSSLTIDTGALAGL